MNLIEITEILDSDSNYGQLLSAIKEEKSGTRVQVIDEAVPFLTASIWKKLQIPILLICPTPEHSRRLYDHLSAWLQNQTQLLRFSESEILPFERLTEDLSTTQERLQT